ncbi:MAG: hypothetical protein LBF66_02775 [Holosporales bacterium]|nr:hypothetical protein [Holosporales bacterium]
MPADKVGFMISLAKALSQHGHTPHFWSKESSVRQARLLTEPKTPSSLTEEAFLLSQRFPTWVCDSPIDAAMAATHAGATVLLLGERSERCDQLSNVSIALVEKNVINKVHTLEILAKSDVIVSIAEESIQDLKHAYSNVFLSKWTISGQSMSPETAVFGFTGLHDSGAFYHCLLAHGYNVRGFVPLLHMQHPEKQIHAMLRMASSSKSILVTTDKDSPFLTKKMKSHIRVMSFDLEVSAELYSAIEQFFSSSSGIKEADCTAC